MQSPSASVTRSFPVEAPHVAVHSAGGAAFQGPSPSRNAAQFMAQGSDTGRHQINHNDAKDMEGIEQTVEQPAKGKSEQERQEHQARCHEADQLEAAYRALKEEKQAKMLQANYEAILTERIKAIKIQSEAEVAAHKIALNIAASNQEEQLRQAAAAEEDRHRREHEKKLAAVDEIQRQNAAEAEEWRQNLQAETQRRVAADAAEFRQQIAIATSAVDETWHKKFDELEQQYTEAATKAEAKWQLDYEGLQKESESRAEEYRQAAAASEKELEELQMQSEAALAAQESELCKFYSDKLAEERAKRIRLDQAEEKRKKEDSVSFLQLEEDNSEHEVQAA